MHSFIRLFGERLTDWLIYPLVPSSASLSIPFSFQFRLCTFKLCAQEKETEKTQR